MSATEIPSPELRRLASLMGPDAAPEVRRAAAATTLRVIAQRETQHTAVQSFAIELVKMTAPDQPPEVRSDALSILAEAMRAVADSLEVDHG